MKRGKWLLLIAVALFAVLPMYLWDRALPPAPAFSYYLEAPSSLRLVKVMSGRPNEQRRQAVKQALDAAAISYTEETVSNRVFSGVNIITELGEGREILLLAAHYDRVPEAPGANDNASCVAAAIKALPELKKVGVPEELTVRFLFTDGEESGLQGARHHADTQDLTHFFGVASFELCGIGDAYGVWDVVGPAIGSPVVEALMQAGKNLNIYNGTHGAVPRFGSDHLPFANKGLAAVGVTVLPQKDENKLRSYVADPNNPQWLLNFVRPVIFQTYHTSGDKAETVQPTALQLTTRLMIETVRVAGSMIKQRG